MSEIKATVSGQLQQLQMLMHRASYHGFMDGGRMRSPHRGQGRVLSILRLKPEISQKELTYLLGMSKQSLAELLAKLEKSGYITREPSEEDKRVVTVKLTEEGKGAAEPADADGEAAGADKTLDCLSDEELALFSGYLSRIIKRYEEQFPGEDFEERRKSLERFMSRYGHGFEWFGEHGGHPHGHGFGGHFRGFGQFHGFGRGGCHCGHFHGHGYSHESED
jgi:DNA-binding MarR family transcriptional regulator